MSTVTRYPWLNDALADGGEVVTASRRLARELRLTYNDSQVSAGQESWPTPRIHSWQGWLAEGLEQARGPDEKIVRLPGHSALLLWEQCLNEVVPDTLQNRAGLLRACAETWDRANDWCLTPWQVSEHARYGDERLFAAAATLYAKRLEKRHLLDAAGMSTAVAGFIRENPADAPAKVLLAGFDRLVPAVRAVVAALESAGSAVSMAPVGEAAADQQIASFTDGDAELRAAGEWARRRLDERPDCKIAIVCSDLERNADRVGRLVREGFVPGWQYAGAEHTGSVEISYGQRLADYPAIAIAVSYLRWTCFGLSSRDVSVLLRSRGSGPRATSGRARLDLRLRYFPDRLWPAGSAVAALAGTAETQDATSWLAGLRELAEFRSKYDAMASPAEWAHRFDELLQTLGWPAAHTLDSTEFQLINRWRSLLNDFAATELITSRIGLQEAVQRISSMASDVLFQPEGEGGRIQVLGILEAAGLRFDALWIAGVDSSRWPAPASPLPLLSRKLQRDHEMPDATPNDTLEFSRRVLDRLLRSAGSVVVSWARTQDDVEQMPSALLDSGTPLNALEVIDPGWHAQQFADSRNTELVVPDPAPALREREKVHGGAYTVQRQYTEPFSAFAFGRLGIREIKPFETGITAATRGTVVHRALKSLYEEKPDLEQVRMWCGQDLNGRIEHATTSGLGEIARHSNATHHRLCDLEKERLQLLLQDFVVAEQDRTWFSVEALECDLTYEVAGVRLELQIDRVDRLEDGRYLIADYKTGAVKHLLRTGDEPVDLQLVVYSCAWTDAVGGLVLINVDRKAIVYKGTGDSTAWQRPRDGDWSERLTKWQLLVSTSMEGIAKGDVRINRSLGKDQSRPLAILSRIEELARGD